jgi:DNA-binding CsgD family transcriptional regulator
MQPLQDLGLSELAEEIYLDLVERGAADRTSLACGRGLDPAELDAALAELAVFELVEAEDTRVVARPPQLALEPLVQRHLQNSELVRRSAATLSRIWKRGVERETSAELLPTARAWRAATDRIVSGAEREVCAVSIGTLVSGDTKIAAGVFDALDRGVAFRVIYGTHVLQDPTTLRLAQMCVEAGEDARVFPELPVNLTIVDQRWAVVGVRSEEPDGDDVAAAALGPGPFLSGLLATFEAFWRMAVPITNSTESHDATGGPTEDTRRLLSYLSAGLTDEAIARQFDVSQRTVARRITRLQEILGAQTRFQLGVQASRQGWL